MENSELSSNPQATPDVAAPQSAGNQPDLAARVAELEKSNEGRLRDLQEERRKRQELEQRLSSVPASPAVRPAEVAVEPQDEVAKVLNPYLVPIRKQAEEALRMQQALLAQRQEEAAYQYLAEKTGKTRKQIEADTEFQQRIIATGKKWGFVGPPDEVIRKAYDAMELEEFRNKQTEKERSVQTSAQASLPAGAPPAPVSNSREMSADEFSRLPAREFERMASQGSFRKVDGKFVYTPQR